MKKGKMGIVLTIAAGAGMIFAIVMTAKKTPEAQKAKEEALAKKREETGNENAQLTFIEAVKVQAPCYAPVIFGTAAAMGSLVVSQVVPQVNLKDIGQTFQTYKDITAKMNGQEGEKLIDQMTSLKLSQSTDGKSKETFVLRFNDENIVFDTTLLDVMEAEYNCNKMFKGTGKLTFNQLLRLFHQEDHGYGDEYGWEDILGDAEHGYSWIDFKHRRGMLNGKPVTFIETAFEPHTFEEDDTFCEVDVDA